MRLALVIKYASARLVSVFYSRERRNFTVCVCISQDRSAGRTLLALTFLSLKFVVADVSVHVALNFDFNGCGRQACSTKNQNLALPAITNFIIL